MKRVPLKNPFIFSIVVVTGNKTENWVIIYESHDPDLIIFVIIFANSSDDTGSMW